MTKYTALIGTRSNCAIGTPRACLPSYCESFTILPFFAIFTMPVSGERFSTSEVSSPAYQTHVLAHLQKLLQSTLASTLRPSAAVPASLPQAVFQFRETSQESTSKRQYRDSLFEALAGKLTHESVIRSPMKNACHRNATWPLFRQAKQHNLPGSSQNARTILCFGTVAFSDIPGCL